jgi:chitodextrinase
MTTAPGLHRIDHLTGPARPRATGGAGRLRRIAVSASVALACALLGLAVRAEVAAAATVPPEADTYVDASSPTRNYGSRRSLRVDGSPERTAYLRFTVTGTSGSAVAVLRFHLLSSSKGVTVHRVTSNTWDEGTMTAATAPAVGALVASIGPAGSGTWQAVNVPIAGDGTYSFAIRTPETTAIEISSREGSHPPQLIAPPPPNPSPFVVSPLGDGTYESRASVGDLVYTGSLKHVVEASVHDLMASGGGTVRFTAGTFDLGDSHFEFYDLDHIVFEGAGMDATLIRNDQSIADDTEPFDMVGTDFVVMRDFAVWAGGPFRSTSDALDFDNGNHTTVERVKVLASRGRGIVFDGKNENWNSMGNVIRDCVVTGVPSDGIELLAASSTTIEGCQISDVGGYGIQLVKSSSQADQPHKKPSDNTISQNVVVNAGLDGINIISGDRNLVVGNLVLNSSDDASGRDGIRITSGDGIACDDNWVEANIATDDQPAKTQKYGLNIASASCSRTVVHSSNDFSGNLVGPIRDAGTDTQYVQPPDAGPPTTPEGVTATATSATSVEVTWQPSTDDIGVVGYTVYRDGSAIAAVAGEVLSFVDDLASPATTYGYSVDAFDAAGNYSPPSEPAVVVTTPEAPAELVLTPSADAYVSETSPSSNYGKATALRVDGSPVLRTYLHFDVVGVTGTSPAAVTLRLFANSSSAVGYEVRDAAADEWGETTITFENAPAPGPDVVAASGPFTSGSYIEVDVTALVTGDGPRTIVVETPSATAISLGSRESPNPPLLVVHS